LYSYDEGSPNLDLAKLAVFAASSAFLMRPNMPLPWFTIGTRGYLLANRHFLQLVASKAAGGKQLHDCGGGWLNSAEYPGRV
jgi:hypothetical protein